MSSIPSGVHVPMERRRFLKSLVAGSAAAATGSAPLFLPRPAFAQEQARQTDSLELKPGYSGPNVIIVRFGGGVRRRETIEPKHTYAPFFCRELAKRGTLFTNMTIDQFQNINTSHGEGTLYILTGKYEKYKDITGQFLGARFESQVPTIFEYLRKAYNVPEHQALIINNEDRTNEEFYSFSNHHLFGANFRSDTLSLYRFKVFLLRRQLEEGKFAGKELEKKQKELKKLEAIDYRTDGKNRQCARIEQFWDDWRQYYGDSGFVNPRGDSLLTELSLRAMREMQPRLMMINYTDPDYVHWGNMMHYTRGIAVIDDGIRRLVEETERSEFYRDNTVFVVVPDCGRDSNPFAHVPCQHHFNSRSSHEIFALITGPGVQRGAVVHDRVDQIALAATIGKFMEMETPFTEAPALEQAFA